MSATIESLGIEVQSKADSAVDGIEQLRETLVRLKTVTSGGAGLGSVKRQLTSLNAALDTMSDSNIDKLNKLALGLKAFDGVGNIKLSSSVASQIGKIGDATQRLEGTDFTVLRDLATSLTPLSTIGKSNLNSFISQLTRLPDALAGMRDSDIKTVTKRVTELSDALAPLAAQMATISSGFSALPADIRSTIAGLNTLTRQADRAANGYGRLAIKATAAYAAIKTGSRTIASWINSSNEYVENLNLFTVSMGRYATEAKKYADIVGEIMGIDPGEWMRNQGIFMTLATGFGVVDDRAYAMSQNLTQLGYDLSSFFNISYEDAMQKLQSGISGELEPLRRLGYDLSAARLQMEAHTLGIHKNVNAMTQAEKAELRYYAIMTQVTQVQGDMARTLEAPANQLRILRASVTQAARALGNIFIPALNAVLPYAIALMNVVRELANVVANLFGFSLPTIDYSGIGEAAGNIADTTDAIDNSLGDAAENAKELMNAMLGIDELNVINTDSTSSSDSSDALSGSGFDFELPTYNFIDEAINTKVEELKETIKELIPYVTAVGTAFAAWKIAPVLIDFIDKLKNLSGFTEGFGSLGFLTLLSDINEFAKYFEDFMDNGASFQNVAGMLSEFAGMLGDSLILLGSLKLGGALKVIQGIGEICVAIKDISENGLNWDNATTAIRGLSNVAIAIGIFTNNIKLSAGAVALQGVATILGEIDKIMEAIRTGDWSGVDKATLAIGIVEVFGGLAVAFDVFSKLKGLFKGDKTKDAMETVADVTGSLDATVTTTLSPKLSSLVKNLGLGLVVITEVVAVALLVTGAIILLGMGLEQVGLAWDPVIQNGSTVAAGMGIGVGVLAGIGVVTALLGSVGSTLIANIALGAVMLAELGVATALFIVEVWAIGKGLDEIGQAWGPVLTNGDTITKGIVLGTALLVGIGVVTAALGVATVASAGTLPVAIGIGTLLLVELAAAFILFTESLVAVADELNDNLSPALEELNGNLPGLSTNMSNFVDFMSDFAGHVVRYTQVSAISSLASTIDTVIGWFTDDPIGKLADDVDNISRQTSVLNEKLQTVNPELQLASSLLRDYRTLLSELESLTNSNVNLSTGMFINMNEVGQNLVSGLVSGVRSKAPEFTATAQELARGFENGLTGNSENNRSIMVTWADNLKQWFTSDSHGGINNKTFRTYAENIVAGFDSGITSSYPESRTGVTTWASMVKEWFTEGKGLVESFAQTASEIVDAFENSIGSNYPNTRANMSAWAKGVKEWFVGSSYGAVNAGTFSGYARNIVNGFNQSVSSNSTSSASVMRAWGNNVEAWFTGTASYYAFYNAGTDVVCGFIDGVNDYYYLTRSVMTNWANSAISWFRAGLDSHSPSRIFESIGGDTVLGYNLAIEKMGSTTKDIIDDWVNSFTDVTPTLSFAVDTSALKYYNSDSFEKSISADVTTNSNVATVGFDGDIVQGISESVYSAVVTAMRESENNSTPAVTVYLDGRQITSVVEKHQHERGAKIVRNGVYAY